MALKVCVQSMLPQLREVMIEGNTLYSIINPPSHNPNLTVDDVLTSLFRGKAICCCDKVPNTGTDTRNCNTWKCKKNSTCFHYGTPPDKSAALIQDKEHVCPFDSHSHKGKGATIIVGNVHQLYTFILFGC